MSVHKLENLFEFKEGENCNRRNTLQYFEDYNFRLTPKSGKLAICGWALAKKREGYRLSQIRVFG